MVLFSASVGLLSDGYLEVPMWIPQLAVPVGAALLLLTALGGLIRLLFEPPEGGP
jgi:TRAP-type C4-dicarboxylate transport system permease small subunit